jgi:hypothetical protein
VKEKMINDCFNASGMTINRFIMPQGVRRDAIAGELGARRYDSAETDIEGDLKAGDGPAVLHVAARAPEHADRLVRQGVSKIELSDPGRRRAGSRSSSSTRCRARADRGELRLLLPALVRTVRTA